MTYPTRLTTHFRDDVDNQIAYWMDQGVAVSTVEGWLAELYDKIRRLENFPELYAIDEFQSKALDCETRKLNMGDHLVFYQLDYDQRQVIVLALIHGAARRQS